MNILEHILSLKTVESIESSFEEHKEKIEQIKTIREDLYIHLLNKICAKVQKISEAIEFNGQIIPLAAYGYWILPDGKEIEIDNKQAHKVYANQHDMDVYQAIDSGWVRLITDTEFVADYNPEKLNQKQFRAIVELLKDNDAFRGYTVFTLGDDADGHIFNDMRQFIAAVRKDVKSTVAHQAVAEAVDYDETYWYNSKTSALIPIGNLTHLLYVQKNPEVFGLTKESKHSISAALEAEWVRMGLYKDRAYIMSDSKQSARKALKVLLGKHPDINLVDIEINDTHRSLEGDQIDKFVSNKLGMKEDVIHFPGSNQKSLYKDLTSAEKLNQTVSWVKNAIDKRNITSLDDILPQLKELANERELDILDVNNAFAKRYGTSIEGYIMHQSLWLNDSALIEGISNSTALKTRNDLIKLAKKLTDSSNVVPMNNFDSSVGKEDITLRLGIFQTSEKKLEEIKDKVLDTLLSQGWIKKKNTFIKDGVKIVCHDIKKVFKTGAYQNREVPHFGIEIVGPKKLITE